MKYKCAGDCVKVGNVCIHLKEHEQVDSCGYAFCPFAKGGADVGRGIILAAIECKPVDKEWVKDEERKD